MLPITVTIRFLARDGREGERSLSADEYFDLAPGESDRAVSIFDLVEEHAHAHSYLGMTPANLVSTVIDVRCEATREWTRTAETFWAEGRCRSIVRREFVDECEVGWTRIVEIGDEKGSHFVRLGSGSTEETNLVEHTYVSGDEETIVAKFPER